MIIPLKEKREAFKNLPTEVQDFITDNETTELISSYLEEAGLSEEENDLADSEILNAMFGLQTLSDAINNIAALSNKDVSNFSELSKNLESNIFSELNRIKNGAKETPYLNQENKEDKGFSANSYEQILINQAKAMRPVGVTPDNLPTEENISESEPKREEPRAIHNSIGYNGGDPYREPLE